jgi:hypothetical protein
LVILNGGCATDGGKKEKSVCKVGNAEMWKIKKVCKVGNAEMWKIKKVFVKLGMLKCEKWRERSKATNTLKYALVNFFAMNIVFHSILFNSMILYCFKKYAVIVIIMSMF